MKNIKKIILQILVIISVVTASVFLVSYISEKLKKPPVVITNNEKELKTIDSLTEVVNIQEEIIQQLKDSIVVVEKVVVKEVEKIKELPITENIMILRDNLVCYGELTEITDPYPTLKDIDNDTLAILSENNLKDVNIITTKYEGEMNKNRLLNEIIYNDSLTISLKDNIIYNKDAIILNQELAYESMQKNLEAALKKEKREKTYWIVGGAIVTSALTTYIILKK